MKRKTLTIGVLLLLGISVALAQTPGPYPVIFLHGQKKEGDPEYGYITWNRGYSWSAMEEILDEGYAGYQEGVTGRDCDENTPIPSTGGDPLRIYNFSYYNTDASMGVIGDNYDTLYPKETDYNTRVDYQNSADNACWGEQLADFIDDVLTATGASKVNIVCHSMGGLVARAAVTYYGCEEKIHKTLMIGTPNWGFWHNNFIDWLITHGISAPIAGREYLKYGELLEMGIDPTFWDSPFPSSEYTRFYDNENLYEEDHWTHWLNYYDPGGRSEPYYRTIAGNRPRWYSGDPPPGSPLENDGVVTVGSVYLGYEQKHEVLYKYHSKNSGDDEEDALTTCEAVETRIKEWILDWEMPRPVITKIEWDGCGGSLSAMALLQPHDTYPYKDQWLAIVHFYFNKDPKWVLNSYHGWSAASGWFWDYYEEYKRALKFPERDHPYQAGETGYWQVKASIHYYGQPQNNKTLTSEMVHSSPPEDGGGGGGGCPELYSFLKIDDSTGAYLFIGNNTILPHSEVFLDTASDYLVLSHSPPAQDSHYYLKIIENGTSTTYLDEIKLYAVDHAPGTRVGTSSNGNTYVYSDVLPPNRCVSYVSEMLEDTLGNPVEYFYSVDHLEEVWYRDTLSFVGEDGESLFVSFPPPPDSWTHVALLISTGPATAILPIPKNYCCIPYSEDGQGGWIPEPAKAFARKKPSDWIVPINSSAAFMSTGNEAKTFKIVCSTDSLAYIDYIALVKLETEGWSMQEAPLDSAVFWEYEEGEPDGTPIRGHLLTIDSLFAPPLAPETQYALSFTALRKDTSQVRDFVLKTHGVYISGWNPGSQLKEHGLLPRKYDLRVDQLMSASRPARISYQVAKAGRVGIQVIDITGRQVTVLVDEYLEAGSYTLDWNGRDARGQRFASGVYFIRMVSGEFAKNVKLVILR